MNPTLLLCLIICPIAFLSSASLFHFGQPGPAAIFALFGVAPLAIGCWQLVFFTKTSPDRLQGERHVEQMFELRNRLTIKDGDTIRELPVSSTLVENPQLEDRRGE